jgi:hypothetical protein
LWVNRINTFSQRLNVWHFERILPLNLVANTAILCVAARLYLLPLVFFSGVVTPSEPSGGDATVSFIDTK